MGTYTPDKPRRVERGRRTRRARRVSLHARHPADDVSRPALDDAAVRRVRHGRGIQRALPLSAGAGRQRPQRRVRPADADGLRLRPSARRRRSRPRRRRDRFDRRHGGAVRRHPARSRLDVDDDQRDGDHPAGALRRGRAAARRRAGEAFGHGSERHPQGVHRPRHVHLSAAPVAAHRHRHLRVLRTRAAAVEHDLDQRLSHPRGRIDRGAGGRVHVRERGRVRAGGDRPPASTSTRSASGCRSSSTRTTTFSRRSRSSARRAGCGRASCATDSARPTRARSSCASTRRPPAAR